MKQNGVFLNEEDRIKLLDILKTEKKYFVVLRINIILLRNNAKKWKEISTFYNCSIKTVANVLRGWNENSFDSLSKKSGQGRKYKIPINELENMKEMALNGNKTSDLKIYFEEKYNKKINRITISRALKKKDCLTKEC
jgi:transposase